MATRQQNLINPNAEIVSSAQCLQVNVAAARGLQGVVRTNLGPRGTLKMLVGGAGQIKITKDGNVLLHEMQIQHPTAMMIARAATAMDDEVGDGTTSSVLFTGELLKQAERFTSEGLHPRLITEGYEIARDMVTEFLEAYKVAMPEIYNDREMLSSIVRTALRTKLSDDVSLSLSDSIINAVMSIITEDKNIDLNMVEIMEMQHKKGSDSKFIDGLVLDHGARHPDMPTNIKNVHILTCNVSMEYEKTEINSSFFYNDADSRDKMVASERKFTDEKVNQLIAFKRSVCKEGESFAVINQKGIDAVSLDMLAKEGIFAVRRAKRRNMERCTLACGGVPVNAFDDLEVDVLGWADHVHEETLGEDKFTFIEGTRGVGGKSCTLLIRGPNKHTIAQINDATRDGLRAVKNVLDDQAVVPGAGSFEVAAYRMLMRRKQAVSGRAKLGVEAFANSMLIIPKVLAENSGLDAQESIIKLEEEQERTELPVGLDLNTGDTCSPAAIGVWDSYSVKKQILSLSTILSTQLLLVDEVMKAGKSMGRKAEPGPPEDE